MFRSAAIQTLRRAQHLHTKNNRSLVTAAQKRALNNEQIAGKETSKKAAEVKPPTSSSGSGGATPPPGGSDGSSPILPIVGGLAIAGGIAYYMDLIPTGGNEEKEVKKEEAPVKKETPAPVVEKKEKVVEKKSVVVKKKKVEEKKKSSTKSNSSGNRVINISAPSTDGRSSEPLPVVEHDPSGSRVSVAKFSQVYTPTEETAAKSKEETTSSSSEEEKTVPSLTSIAAAESELTSVTSSKIDDALKLAHVTMRVTLDETFLKDLDKLNENELRIRIAQLASEMGERTKWEAVRLREFLSMKEKEVGDKYLELMQKQRLEFEDLLARRMREQEYQLTKQANEAIDAKEKTVESIINAAASAQQAEHEAALKSTEERLDRELNAKYESEFGNQLAEAKAQFANELQAKVGAIEQLTERLTKNEENLQISRNFESGSQRAHRISAAALALAEKMETSKGAMEEFVALKSAAVENGVIASALEKIPGSVKAGIPTLSELQATFDDVHRIGRSAAYVPSGQSGVEGQLAGMIFAKLTVEPSADSMPPPKTESGDIPQGKMSDFILSKAKRHVQLGELEEAVVALDKLEGQAAYTVNDWKVAAMNRIAVDQALKVIKLECALMNKNMAG